jgi:mRNA-degrading endonuclease RelE of RelBE toxin-antitoxin system
MKVRVEISEQVARFIARQAPEPRKALRAALRQLESERGDIKPLEGELRDYYRLRVRGFRIIFAYAIAAKQRVIRCIFAERRHAVYEVFEELLKKHLLSNGVE